jgi:hypothetical protein
MKDDAGVACRKRGQGENGICNLVPKPQGNLGIMEKC